MVTKRHEWRPVAESHSFRGSLSSEPDEIILPGWLNSAKGSQSYSRVTRIMDLICAADKNVADIRTAGAHVHTGRNELPKEHLRLWRINREIWAELGPALTKYTFNVRLIGFLLGQRWLLSICCKRRKNEFAWEAPYAYKAGPGETILNVPTFMVSEGDAVLAIGRLAERGLLSRVRLCAMCSDRWFFAKHSNYRFCGEQCRQKHFTSGDQYRQRKALQMRAYRSRQKHREEAERTYFSSSE